MVKHNNVIPNGHFKKHWQNYVKTWFNQPARKARRRIARQKKAVRIFPRPTAGPLRPIVHGQTLKYNMKLRAGRGFTLEELKAAGISKKLAPTIGISVDHRRKNRSLEGLQTNVQRLKTYKAKLVVFPRRARKFKAGDSTAEELATSTQVQGPYLPISREKPSVELVKITEEMKSFKAYNKLRVERMNERHIGARLKKAAEAEKEDKKAYSLNQPKPNPDQIWAENTKQGVLEAVEEKIRNQEKRGKELYSLSISLTLQEPPSSEANFDLPLCEDIGGRIVNRREVKSSSNNYRFSQARVRNDEREKDIFFEQRLEGAISTKKIELLTTPEPSGRWSLELTK
ncbi:hypothetical protein V6N12_027453 [Hibiscus sabdariffa]|uniref:60S ribosomal protein L13 n=1 Tax=Hibiscus sabdariffa TaxID=183260 RepID=A0ABR2DV67_9ROSI